MLRRDSLGAHREDGSALMLDQHFEGHVAAGSDHEPPGCWGLPSCEKRRLTREFLPARLLESASAIESGASFAATRSRSMLPAKVRPPAPCATALSTSAKYPSRSLT